jgi:hypothetical protein
MTAQIKSFPLWSRARQATTAATFALLMFGAAACNSSEFLGIEDPDIVNPSDVQSLAGANAVRLGAMARLNSATSGDESLLLLGGLFADEWQNGDSGDSFIARQEIDQRVVTFQNTFLTAAIRVLHRARLSAEQAVGLLEEHNPTGPVWQRAEMFFVQGYVVNLLAEHMCSGLTFSTVVNGAEQFGSQITTTAAFDKALEYANAGLALITGTTTDDVRVKSALQVLKGRILLNLNRPADASTAVNGVATSYRYNMLHAATTTSNNMWSFNNNARRYSVSTAEGTNGANFATAADPRLPICLGGDAACRAVGVTNTRRDDQSASPMHVQLIWPARESSVAIVSGIEARLIEAEAQLRGGNPNGSLGTLNTARATVTGLGQLADAGTEAARVDQLFRERAFWLFGRGHRVGDLRRLIRQYSRAANTVFPVGAWHKGGNYGVDVNLPNPQAEENNPNVPAGQTCLDRNA